MGLFGKSSNKMKIDKKNRSCCRCGKQFNSVSSDKVAVSKLAETSVGMERMRVYQCPSCSKYICGNCADTSGCKCGNRDFGKADKRYALGKISYEGRKQPSSAGSVRTSAGNFGNGSKSYESKKQSSSAGSGSASAYTLGDDRKPYAVVFICRGPDPSGLTNILSHMAMSDRGLYEAMAQLGFKGPRSNLIALGPDWNKTVYSSWKPTPDEVDDLISKIKKELSSRGFTYRGEDIRTARYDPSTSYGKMGLFMAYIFIKKN